MQEALRDWDGEYVVTRLDQPTGTWMFIAIHSTALGVATGGTRLKPYAEPAEALRDALRLGEGMTHKFAVIDFPRGGGKAVLAVPRGFAARDRESLLLRYGQWLARLGGIFETGADLGTGSSDMDLIARHYGGVFGRSRALGGAGDPGPETALGVFSGIRASCERAFGTSHLAGRTFLVQGVGSVGLALSRLLLEAGGEVRCSDVDPARVNAARQELGVAAVEPEAVYDEPCDVFAPCAVGGTLAPHTIPRLRCRIVAGAANNQLSRPEDGEALHQRGILYAPDYVVNAGGAIFLPAVESMGWSEEQARERIRKIGDTLQVIYGRAQEQDVSPARAAQELALERVRRGKS
jgi:leucine dehydrogenase